MSDDKNPIEKLAEDLADRKAIDWGASKQSHSESCSLIDQLNVIAKISEAYDANSDTDHVKDGNSRVQVLFEWGHLQALEKIGEGSYGEVYRAYDSVLDREVALKLLKKDRLAPIESRSFIQEARRLAKVRNRHVLAIHGANVYEGSVGIWSDLIAGINLAEKQPKSTSENNLYSANQMIPLINALTDALIAVHDAGLIHGDIKPSNVMVDAEGKFTLMDFGAGTEFDFQNSQTGYLIGTLLYMAPELFEKNKLSSASDIYALGVLLFNLATKNFPILGENLALIKQAHIDGNYKPIEHYRNDLPKSIRVLIQQMMVVDPMSRPSAIEIKKKMNWIIAAPQRRNKRIAVTLIVGLSILGTLISGIGFYRANQAQQQAVQEKEKAEAFSDFMRDTLKAPASLGKGKEVRVADLLATAADEAAVKFVNQPASKAAIFHAIGDSYNSLKLPEDALKHLSESLLSLKQIYGENAPEILDALLEVAESHHVVGDDVRAKEIYLKAIDIAELNRMDHESVFARIKLADLIRVEGNYADSVKMLDSILSQMPSVSSQQSLNYYLALTVQAQNHLRLSDYPLAENTAKKALQWLNIHHPEDDIKRNEVLNIIARTLIWQRKLPEAESISRAVVSLVQKLYGELNYEYLRANTLLSTTLFEQGKLSEALVIQEYILTLPDKVQGDNRLYTVIISNNLANTKIKMRDHEGAEHLLQNALALAHEFLEDDNVQILTLELNQLGLMNDMGRYFDAEQLAKKTRAKVINKLSEQHMFNHLILSQMAVSYAGQMRFDEALSVHQNLLFTLTSNNQDKSSQMITVLEHYVSTLIRAGEIDEAREKLMFLLDLQQQLLGADHPDTIASGVKLADL